MISTIYQTSFHFPKQTNFYCGKVRDIYTFDDKIATVVTDRISAFDQLLPKGIPYKGQVLNQMSAKLLQSVSHIVPQWIIDVPEPNVTIGLYCKPIPIEMVIRGYLSGYAWRMYQAGYRIICGATMPEGMQENDPFPSPIITPTIKLSTGHDKPITPSAIVEQGIVTASIYQQLVDYTYALFQWGTRYADERGLILVDTKYEFGLYNNVIYLIDEIHTPDSSRFFYKALYQSAQEQGIAQQQLSKEFVRAWLIKNGFQRGKKETMPCMTADFVQTVSKKYIALYEHMTDSIFVPCSQEYKLQYIQQVIAEYF